MRPKKKVAGFPPSFFILTLTPLQLTMPTQKPTNPLYYDEERRYNEAKEAYLDGQFEDVTKCAKAFNLNRRNLANRINGGCSKSTRRAANQRLTEAQELALFNYI